MFAVGFLDSLNIYSRGPLTYY